MSSTLEELAPERRTARAAVEGVRLTPVMFELGARPHPPRELYRAYLAQSDVFVGIYWQRYGWVAPGEAVSGLEDEYALSGDRPKLIYVKAPAPDREPRLGELLQRIQADDRASYKTFSDGAELAELLADDLAVLLTERFTAREQVSSPGLRPAALPVPLTRMIGRDTDRDGVVARFRDGARLVTLTGPGGIGKTRLALDVAAALQHDLFDGVWFVDLAAESDPSRMLGAIASALGVRASGRRALRDVLADQLTGRRALLLLDNLEHLPSAATDVGRLLAAVPDVGVLATSRTVLRLRGEHEWPLAPLAVPTAEDSLRAPDVAASPAVQLFVARAVEVNPSFVLTAENAGDVGEICRRLDGIPLAIELAAARVRMLPPSALRDRLGQRLDLDSGLVDLPERQRTLRSTLDWSYRLLDPPERLLLTRLSVFPGGWTLRAAEAMAGTDGSSGPADVVTLVSSLVDKSLVTADDGASAAPRFRMLGVIRQYAEERLDERSERKAALDRMAQVVMSFVQEVGAGLRTGFHRWAPLVDDELDNVRLAWRHAVEVDDAETAYAIATPLAYYFWARSLIPEVLELADAVAALPSASRLDPAARGRLLWGRATSFFSMGRPEGAAAMLAEALRMAEDAGDEELAIRARVSLSYLATEVQIPQLRTALEDGVAWFRRRGELMGAAYTLSALGQLLMRTGEVAGVAAVFQECLGLGEQIDNEHLQTLALHQLGFDALLHGQPDRARTMFDRSLAANEGLLDQEGVSYCLDGFALIARMEGRMATAARLHAAAERIRGSLGLSAWPALRRFHDDGVAAVRSALGVDQFEREWRAGLQLRPVDALAHARQDRPDVSAAEDGPATAVHGGPPRSREADVEPPRPA
ncbi:MULTISPECIES: ATP-binding protein [unclassified Geodermatophilus]|uniref:ATP-binding protein n=1 Tax=unclassified Geodermatophilus TaxID=2637632 RepID=UPI003EEE877E